MDQVGADHHLSPVRGRSRRLSPRHHSRLVEGYVTRVFPSRLKGFSGCELPSVRHLSEPCSRDRLPPGPPRPVHGRVLSEEGPGAGGKRLVD